VAEVKSVLEKLKEIESGEVGINIYSTKEQKNIIFLNNDMKVPLASAGKVVLGFCIAKWVEGGLLNWDDLVEEISFDPKEDSIKLYPHLQQRTILLLSEAIEVMIACHDNDLAKRIAKYCRGWDKIKSHIQMIYPKINITENPRDPKNEAQLDQILELMKSIFQGYKTQPLIWLPIINGLVRQEGGVKDIPIQHLNHMTGGLEHALIDIGVMGDFNNYPFIYVIGAAKTANRNKDHHTDNKIIEAMLLMYEEYKQQK
jgi:Beta-lactamase enzyme family